jgi:hypothetical protein
MVLNTIVVSVVAVVVALLAGIVAWGLLSTVFQEADDASESQPKDLIDFEKRQTHRSDVMRR